MLAHNLTLRTILLFLYTFFSITVKYSIQDEDIYLKSTGKTREELLKSGQYVPVDMFTNKKYKEGFSSYKNIKSDTVETRGRANTFQQTYYDLFTLKNPDKAFEINASTEVMDKSPWDKTLPVKILIHGFAQSGTSEEMPIAIKNAYMKKRAKYNVICVDWRESASVLHNYFTFAAPNTEYVGEDVGRFIDFLVTNEYIPDAQSIHIIGFSLGAHVAAVASITSIKLTGKIVYRITGLDPAGPGFGEDLDKDLRLDEDDAYLVDVIHTNAGKITTNPLTLALGTDLVCGHVDFYPNGGTAQGWDKYCGNLGIVGNLVGLCHHLRAAALYAESITETDFAAIECKDWNEFKERKCPYNYYLDIVQMGEYCHRRAYGKRYLKVPAD